jgi:hypothetical protein
MGPPTEDGFKKQAEIVRMDEETKDLCRQLIESNKKNRQLQKEKLQLQKENLQLKAKLEVIFMFLKLVEFRGLSKISLF